MFIKTMMLLTAGFLSVHTGVEARQDQQLEGIIEPSRIVELSSQVPGILEEVAVDRGERVSRGQVIATLKSDVEKAAVELAHARVGFGKRKVERNSELNLKQLISAHEKDEMETELQIAELQLREAEEKLELRTIRSPIDGIVVERFRSPGEYIGENPIVKIAGIDPLYVEVVVPVERFGSIRKGMRAEVVPEIPIPGKHVAKVIMVDRIIDAGSGTFGVRLELPNPKLVLPAGLKCRVRFMK